MGQHEFPEIVVCDKNNFKLEMHSFKGELGFMMQVGWDRYRNRPKQIWMPLDRLDRLANGLFEKQEEIAKAYETAERLKSEGFEIRNGVATKDEKPQEEPKAEEPKTETTKMVSFTRKTKVSKPKANPKAETAVLTPAEALAKLKASNHFSTASA